jgi:formylglycine-generating enzyme required for sulfatase activity
MVNAVVAAKEFMQVRLCSLFIVLSLVAGVHAGPLQPALRIVPAAGQSVLIWPTNVANYSLQSTTNLAAQNWLAFSNAVPVIVSSNFTVTVTNNSKAMFFRLFLDTNAPSGIAGMILIPAGMFTIGDTLDGESDAVPTNVTLSAFLMDSNQVSYSQWQSVYNWATNSGYGFTNAGAGKAADHPVQTVDWYDSVKWCNARSQQAGLTPVYYTDAALTQLYTNGETTSVFADWTAKGCRLPTEAEWEKAARGGLTGQRFPWGDTIDWSLANYRGYWLDDAPVFPYDLAPTNGYAPAFNDGVLPYTSPVGTFAANGYGLYDMAGNVEEWCWDWYDNNLGAAGSPYAGGTDPHGPAASPFGLRVSRGGSWEDTADLARCAQRVSHSPILALNNFGLRCVRAP